jgi:hypothetical protein
MEKFEPGWLIRLSHDLTRFAPSDAVPARLMEEYRTNTLPSVLSYLAVRFGRLGLDVSRSQAHELHTKLQINPRYDFVKDLDTLIKTVELKWINNAF